MATIFPRRFTSEDEPQEVGREVGTAQRTIGWASLFMALLQSVCGAIVAINGLRLAIGLGSLALSASGYVARFHADRIRIPMIVIAVLGSMVNLAILLHVRHLRKRPASQWRQKPLSGREVRMERVQWILSVLTLLFVGIEEYLHFSGHHTL